MDFFFFFSFDVGLVLWYRMYGLCSKQVDDQVNPVKHLLGNDPKAPVVYHGQASDKSF